MQQASRNPSLVKAITYLSNHAFSRSENLKLDESCISNPKSEIANWTVSDAESNLIFRISDLRCRIRPISKCLRSMIS